MFETYFPKPISSVTIIQLDAYSIQANFYIFGEIVHQAVIPIFSEYNPPREEPEVDLAREQWQNLI